MGIYFVLMISILLLIMYMTNKHKETEKFGLVHVDDIMFNQNNNTSNIYDYTKVYKRK